MKKIPYLQVPGGNAPGPRPERFTVADTRSFFHDLQAVEHVRITGQTLDFYSLDREHSTIDPVYNEPIDTAWLGPYNLSARISRPQRSVEADETGRRGKWDGKVWIPRLVVEKAGAPKPKEGDVVRFWSLPYFALDGNLNTEVPQAGYCFDVTLVEDEAHIHDTPTFVGFALTLVRRSEFTPERKLRM